MLRILFCRKSLTDFDFRKIFLINISLITSLNTVIKYEKEKNTIAKSASDWRITKRNRSLQNQTFEFQIAVKRPII